MNNKLVITKDKSNTIYSCKVLMIFIIQNTEALMKLIMFLLSMDYLQVKRKN